jgi:hypothetical protein
MHDQTTDGGAANVRVDVTNTAATLLGGGVKKRE